MEELPTYRINTYEEEGEIRKKVSIYFGGYIFSIFCDSTFKDIYNHCIQDSLLNELDNDEKNHKNQFITKDQYHVSFPYWSRGTWYVEVIDNLFTKKSNNTFNKYVIVFESDNLIKTIKYTYPEMTNEEFVLEYNYESKLKSARSNFSRNEKS